MPMSAVAAATPYYLLRHGNRCIGPDCVALQSGIECSAVYGFSSRTLYDNFCGGSPLELTPYPLVKVYLRNQMDTTDGCLTLLVLDAAGPKELSLNATTMEAVLTAHTNRMNEVTVMHHLTFDQDDGAYRVDEDSI